MPLGPYKDLCSVDGCTKNVHVKSRMLCNTHYHRWYRHGDPNKIKSNRRLKHPGTNWKIEDLAWAAGFMDGEGSFYTRTPRSRGRTSRQLIVSAAQTDPRPLEKLKSMFGGSISGPYRRKNSTKDIWQWQVGSFMFCQAIIAALWPFMKVKREQASNALKLYHSLGGKSADRSL